MNDFPAAAPDFLGHHAFDRMLDPPGGVVAEVRGLLKDTVFRLLDDVESKLTGQGFVVIHGYEDLTAGNCSNRCHQKVGRAYLMVQDGDRSAKLTFTGCADRLAESWMVESHISFNRMPPSYVGRCMKGEEIESFATEELSGFLLSIARYQLAKAQRTRESDIAHFWDDL